MMWKMKYGRVVMWQVDVSREEVAGDTQVQIDHNYLCRMGLIA